MAAQESQMDELAARLLQATERGTLGWDDLSDTAFETSVGNATVVVKSRDADGDFPYELQLLNPGGTVVDSVTRYRGGDPWVQTSAPLERLYEVARRVALNVDAVIAEALSALPPVDEPSALPPEDDDLPF